MNLKNNFAIDNPLSKTALRLFYGFSLAYILLGLIAVNYYVMLIIPIVVIIAFIAILSYDWLLFVIAFFTPLSLELNNFMNGLPVDLSLPTEPLLFGILIIVILKFTIERQYDKRILFHPVSIMIILNLVWIFITSITSTMMVVSLKFFLARLWFVVPMYFVAIILFSKYNKIKPFIWVYTIPLCFVVLYATINLISGGVYEIGEAHMIMKPFFRDHTSYGAILAMILPVIMALANRGNYSKIYKIFIWGIVALLIFGTLYSYTRAAWVSLVMALGVWVLVKLKIRFRTLAVITILLGLFLYFYSFDIYNTLRKNSQDSSENFMKHIESIANVETDASNLERINRWKSAIEMFSEKPFLGWGPGTYMFQYAPYQLSKDRTIISTNLGEVGNAHSEYIGPLTESGWMGTLTFILIIISTIMTALKVYHKSENKEIKAIALSLMLGLVTYYIHGTLNNFLDLDKASVPFWAFTAIIVALDLYHVPKKATDVSTAPDLEVTSKQQKS